MDYCGKRENYFQVIISFPKKNWNIALEEENKKREPVWQSYSVKKQKLAKRKG